MNVFALLVTAVQVGVIGAVSALVAPTVFKALEQGTAGVFLRRLFPRYFATAAVLAILASVAATFGGHALAATLLAANALCFVVARALVPAINAARDREDPAFARLHRISVLLNAAALLLALAALGMLIALWQPVP